LLIIVVEVPLGNSVVVLYSLNIIDRLVVVLYSLNFIDRLVEVAADHSFIVCMPRIPVADRLLFFLLDNRLLLFLLDDRLFF